MVDKSKSNKIKAEESFPISEQGYTMGKLLDGTECQTLLDTEASKSFMSKSHYLHAVNCSIDYQNLHLKHKEFRKEMNNFSVFYS